MEIKNQIEILYESALSLKNEHINFDIGIIDEKLANRIYEQTGLNLKKHF